jgi:hypothetical protein
MPKVSIARVQLNRTARNLEHPAPEIVRENTLKKWINLATQAQLLGWHSHGGRMTTKPSVIQRWMERRGHWQMESIVNPKNDSAKITARYVINNKIKEFILPSNLSAEERKEYPLRIKNELKSRFKEQINKRLLPHMKRRDYDAIAKVRLKMELKMRNQEEKERERTVHTKQFDVRLKSGVERNNFFKKIDEEWYGVYRRFTSENFLKNIDEDVLNPEVKMNRDDYNEGNSWDYWSIYSIKSMTIEIQFPFSKNNATHIAQVMKGSIEHYVEYRLVSSKEWRENNGDEDEINDKYSQPR